MGHIGPVLKMCHLEPIGTKFPEYVIKTEMLQCVPGHLELLISQSEFSGTREFTLRYQ